jgi:hypothetical protein
MGHPGLYRNDPDRLFFTLKKRKDENNVQKFYHPD